jgi:hypothetical protein
LISARDDQRHHELFEGVSTDGGETWTWTAVTADSTADNIRPIVPVWDAEHTAVLWLRGTYTGYHDYDLDVVGLIAELDTRDAADDRTSADAAQDPGRLGGAIWCRSADRVTATALSTANQTDREAAWPPC